ncbi:hypothetical protein [Synechococcus sp. CS-1332]|uniref:hypothetical protein n=1 Tax=Synechococcus sp. CS-1332 TaxID=2847972 RepID=UPI00223BB256|nr:hypothetical protein [Synechococcus sp. CS-1332]MCT0206364.1 hypothetical protein [Synechococcus sp. CS-1332]
MTHQPLIGGCAHANHPNLSQDVYTAWSFYCTERKQPVQGVVLDGDETIQAAGGIGLGFH